MTFAFGNYTGHGAFVVRALLGAVKHLVAGFPYDSLERGAIFIEEHLVAADDNFIGGDHQRWK